MKERPILFSGPMVRAILEGRKTQTRRVVKPQPWKDCRAWFWKKNPKAERYCDFGWADDFPANLLADECPYGQIGDRLWVRETWGWANACPGGDSLCREDWVEVGYRASDSPRGEGISDPIPRSKEEVGRIYDQVLSEMAAAGVEGDGYPQVCRWRPSIHMPRWASRLLLEVVEVRAERLQDIREYDAEAEGVTLPATWAPGKDPTYRHHFANLWDSINAKRGYPWASNPWVWALTFRRLP